MKYTLLASVLVLAGCTAIMPTATQHFDLEAHRGGRGLAPENTLAAFSNAVDMGVTTLELDIGLTSDGVVVISHDTSLNPDHTRDASGAWLAPRSGAPIRTLTLAQLQTYDVGRINPASNYGKQFALQIPRDGERIPTLASLFAQVQARGAEAATVRFNIETKIDPSKPDETAAPEPMVRALLAEIDKANMAGRVTIQSFDWRTLTLVGKLAPQMPRAYLTTPRTLKDSRWTDGLDAASFASVPQMVRAASANAPGPVVWSPAFADLTPEVIREAHKLGLKVLPWTVNQRADMQRLMDWGADGIITDYPDILRDLMRERGLSLPPPGRNAS
ncbi:MULTISPECIES: glycerophosphodiester phosphodiesterase [Variovorax]|jgi:glycerophosphoryl diester phosphodiesterase|uniref:glycerophosphodiester phosphodiesterase n=1 Tax=Variovorax atrisoli TaxID=3394203 RepID=UPI000360C3F6|nr:MULTISPECIES: glycerophosphodiester phosphodiesterase [Variovorax]MDR6521931.1 glycerophosphoryl diester phosphodiesterase [Variovorax paradoxus]RTD86033.1 glycerophosphodiester phosphodiesterase [Variovorax sp. 369]